MASPRVTEDVQASMEQEVQAVSADAFRQGMRQVATPVALATTCHDGRRAGLTVSSFCSLTAEPPRLLLCLNCTSEAFSLLREGQPLAVNILRFGQEGLARRFASGKACPGEERFEQGDWGVQKTGAPVLADSLVSFDCRVARIHDAGTHAIVASDIVAVHSTEGEAALIHRDGAFLHV